MAGLMTYFVEQVKGFLLNVNRKLYFNPKFVSGPERLIDKIQGFE